MVTPEFDFKTPYKTRKKLRIVNDKKNEPAPEYFERHSAVQTPDGFVQVDQLHWATNSGPQIFTHFETVINGTCYSAFIDQARLSDAQISSYANSFIRIIKHAYQ